MKKIINLDALKADSQKVAFLGKEFEVGYIPSKLAIPLIENHNHNIETQKETDSDEKILDDQIKSVSLFCSFYEPEFTEEFLGENATAGQIDNFYQIVVYAILNNFMGKVPLEKSMDMDEVKKKLIGEN